MIIVALNCIDYLFLKTKSTTVHKTKSVLAVRKKNIIAKSINTLF